MRPLTSPAGIALIVVAALTSGARARLYNQQPPTFRAGVNFVRVDVYPSANGRPVADLTKDDFDVLEDGAPQTIATFEHVSVRSGAPGARVEPRDVREANQMASDPRNRLFVLFLDTYHVTDPTSWHDGTMRLPGSAVTRKPAEKKPLGPGDIDKAIVRFLDRAIGADDLVAAMSPEMNARGLTFTRRPGTFEEWVGTVWGRRFSWDDLDPEEERWGISYPPDNVGDPYGCYKGIFEEMVLRRREDLTLRSLLSLVDRLGDLREGRKATLVISEGWAMYRPNQRLARPVPRISSLNCPPEVPRGPGVYVGPDGKLTSGTDPRAVVGPDWQQSESARVRLALVDSESTYRALFDRANRANVSFYPIDPRGLAVFDTPMGARGPGSLGQPSIAPTVIADQDQLRTRLETLRTLASATDGRMTETNDLFGGMKRIADDLSEYYLLGYNSTNQKFDGQFRRITVRVRRPGVEVRARRGYRAPTEEEVKLRARAEAARDPKVQARETALASLDRLRPDRPLRLLAGLSPSRPSGAGAASGAADTSARGGWIVLELDGAAARRPEWSEGASALITVAGPGDGPAVTVRAVVSPTVRAVLLHPSELRLVAGEYVVRARVEGRPGSVSDPSELFRLSVPEPEPGAPARFGDPLLFRRGPYTGPAFQPTAEVRFRKAERLRVDVPTPAVPDSVVARVLDRKGMTLGLPTIIGQREDAAGRFLTVEVALAPLAQGDYLIEVSARFGEREETSVTAIRIVL